MLKRRITDIRSSAAVANHTDDKEQAAGSPLKYPRPKVLLIDCGAEVGDAISAAGYNVASGTFGRPYRVELGDGYVPVIGRASLPGYSEQEIVVVNLADVDPTDGPEGEMNWSRSAKGLWAPADRGIIDPRPKMMNIVREDFDRIHEHGGIFVVFTAPRKSGRYVVASDPSRYMSLKIDAHAPFDTWSFLRSLDGDHVKVEPDVGREMSIPDDAGGASSFLRAYLVGSQFSATLHPTWQTEDRWITLAHNKYEQPVAGVIVPEQDSNAGIIVLLPQLGDMSGALVEMLGTFLPTVAPRLFPHAEGTNWVIRPEYELPRVVELKGEIEDVRRRAREDVVRLESAIETERASYGYIHDLLTQTGDELVSAVRTALKGLGFIDVRDVDADSEVRDPTAVLREDLQIHDRSPLLLVEVKGIGGLPTEADSLQVTKYLAPRMKELERLDIQGLSVINHQRHLPALDRQNASPFQEDVLVNAREQLFGLLTTWDLFRLARNAYLHGWNSDVLLPVIYRTGRIEPVPEHFTPVGVIAAVWPKAEAIGIQLQASARIREGDLIAVEGAVDFSLGHVVSLQVDDAVRNDVVGPLAAGAKTSIPMEAFRNRMRVFTVGEH